MYKEYLKSKILVYEVNRYPKPVSMFKMLGFQLLGAWYSVTPSFLRSLGQQARIHVMKGGCAQCGNEGTGRRIN
jgi:hypothetical protein